MSRAIQLDPERFGEIVRILSTAFCDYPVMRYVLGDAGKNYDSRLRALVGYFTESRFARGYPVLGIENAGNLVAAANINPPHLIPAPTKLEQSFEALGRTLGTQAIARFNAFADACDPLEPSEPHFYLGMIGVAPDAQGYGYARELLDALHEMSAADADSTGTCLTTELAANLGLYKHFGYRTMGRAVTADGELESWTMFRSNPSSARA
jgi:ribosomal protein S18 acetylase RimI-like enzyme